ncbi:hypothetical protein SAMN05421734_10343 [Pelagirhabdus alkalitolerans]|uniref:Uncharacterized protein n=1 Tax=Pelagirhabdus alkalitolerans TaxID=1612202 RepID=A0A1G6HIX5_9BACI|nr:hypothetical protein [Pelagirhabdus alkalitolerans]SDB94219.1 hypothetical protein SAMN05421734_10343 [Pelagirhabdus alkalitolerans]
MATKSFTTDFKFNQKQAQKLINAIENSKDTQYKPSQRVNEVSDPEAIKNIIQSTRDN